MHHYSNFQTFFFFAVCNWLEKIFRLGNRNNVQFLEMYENLYFANRAPDITVFKKTIVLNILPYQFNTALSTISVPKS